MFHLPHFVLLTAFTMTHFQKLLDITSTVTSATYVTLGQHLFFYDGGWILSETKAKEYTEIIRPTHVPDLLWPGQVDGAPE